MPMPRSLPAFFEAFLRAVEAFVVGKLERTLESGREVAAVVSAAERQW